MTEEVLLWPGGCEGENLLALFSPPLMRISKFYGSIVVVF